MVARPDNDGRQYIYAVVAAGGSARGDQAGIEGLPVGAVAHGPVAALTSPAPEGRVRPSRANLTAHQKVVSEAHAAGPVLPVRFGTVMPNRAAVVDELLEPRRRHLEELLRQLEDRDEFRVKCRYLPDVALREVVERNRTIRRLRERMTAAGRAPRQGEQIQLGELVMAELERLRRADAAVVMEWLSPHVLAWEPVDDPSDDVPLHAAVMVDRRTVAHLEASLERVAERQRDRMHVELIGPLPLWDFTQLVAGAA